jgi:hypothetical protein
MATEPLDRTGILILRVWIEPESPAGFRARITQKLNTMAADQTVATAATADEIYVAVQHWVEAFRDLHQSRSNGVAHGEEN